MDLKTIKNRLRRAVKARILAMDSTERARQERALVTQFSTLPGFETATTVLLYLSAFPEEFATRGMLVQTLRSGKRLILPRVIEAERSLRLFEVTDLDRDLVSSPRGIFEPTSACAEVEAGQIDWVLVPGLAFDRRGFRLGRGAGHYDRLLPRLRPDASTWSMVLEPQWVEAVPTQPHDRAVGGVAGPWGFQGNETLSLAR